MKAWLLIATLACAFLPPAASSYAVNYSAQNLRCWVTPDFYQSQPLYIDAVEVPEGAQVLLEVSAGRGSAEQYSLRECRYTACTTYQYYNANCPIISTQGFGPLNLTGVLSPGTHYLTLDSIIGFQSRELTAADLEVSLSNFSFTASQSFEFLSNYTVSTTAVNVSDESGLCSVEFNSDSSSPSVSSSRGSENFSLASNFLEWNCSAAHSPYSAQWLLPAVQRVQLWKNFNSSLRFQTFSSTLQLLNPATVQNYSAVPFAFFAPENFTLVSGAVNGSTPLAAEEGRNLTALFNASVISYNYSATARGALDNVTITRVLRLFNNFSPTPVTIAWEGLSEAGEWPCNESAEIQPLSSTILSCLSFFPLNYSINGSTLLVYNNLPVEVTLFNLPATLLRLSGENYSTPEVVYIAANSTATVNISKIEPPLLQEAAAPQAPAATSAVAAAGIAANETQEENQSAASLGADNETGRGGVEKTEPAENGSLEKPSAKFSSPLTGLATADLSPYLNFLPFALLAALLAGAPLAFKKRKIFFRDVHGNKVEFIVTNDFPAPMERIVIQEIIEGSAEGFSLEPKQLSTVLGNALEWRKESLASGETWKVSYFSSKPKLNRARVHFEVKGEEKEIIL